MCRGDFVVNEANLEPVYVNNSLNSANLTLQDYETASIILRPATKYS